MTWVASVAIVLSVIFVLYCIISSAGMEFVEHPTRFQRFKVKVTYTFVGLLGLVIAGSFLTILVLMVHAWF